MHSSGSLTRILIGAVSFADAELALRLADRIAQSHIAELRGVLIDEDLLADLVALPGQRIVTPAGQVTHPPSEQELQTLVAADARAFRDMLARIAGTRDLKWSFERRRGRLIDALRAAAKDWDLLILGHREMHRRPGRVVHVTPASGASERAERLAADLAEKLKTELVTLSLPRTGATEPPATTGPADVARDARFLARLSRINAAAVLVDLATVPLQSEDDLRLLLEAARCPVCILGTA